VGTLAEALDRALTARRMSLAQLSRRLKALGDPVGVSTLGSWRSGRRVPQYDKSIDALIRVEEILGLEAGELVSCLPPRRKPGPDPRREFGEFFELSDAQKRLYGAIGFEDPYAAAVTGYAYTVDYAEDRTVSRLHAVYYWKAVADRVASVPIYLGLDSPLHHEPGIEVRGGCLTKVLYDDDGHLLVGELVLPQPLALGETAVTEHTFTGVRQAVDETALLTVAERRTAQASLWLRFHPAAVPHRCWSYTETADGRERQRVAHVDGSLQVVRQAFGPGVFGFEWQWDDGGHRQPAR